jgi:acyl carrier protein
VALAILVAVSAGCARQADKQEPQTTQVNRTLDPSSQPPTRSAKVSSNTSHTARPNHAEIVSRVRQLIAWHFAIKHEAVRPEQTFAELGFDELDVVELMMETKKEFAIEIDAGSLAKAAGASSSNDLIQKMTVAMFAKLVKDSLDLH